MKYTLRKGQNKEDVLEINGIDSVCPFVGGIPMQSNMGGLQILRMPCTTQCPHATVTSEGEFYIISCGSEKQKFAIEKNDEKQKPTILKIS